MFWRRNWQAWMIGSIWRAEWRKQSMLMPKFWAQGYIDMSHGMERLRELQGDNEFCFRSDISFFRKRLSFLICLLGCLCGCQNRFASGVQWGSLGDQRQASLSPTSLGFLDNRPKGPEASFRHQVAAGLSVRALALNQLVQEKSSEARYLMWLQRDAHILSLTSRSQPNLAPSAHWQAAKLLSGNRPIKGKKRGANDRSTPHSLPQTAALLSVFRQLKIAAAPNYGKSWGPNKINCSEAGQTSVGNLGTFLHPKDLNRGLPWQAIPGVNGLIFHNKIMCLSFKLAVNFRA